MIIIIKMLLVSNNSYSSSRLLVRIWRKKFWIQISNSNNNKRDSNSNRGHNKNKYSNNKIRSRVKWSNILINTWLIGRGKISRRKEVINNNNCNNSSSRNNNKFNNYNKNKVRM